MTGLLPEQTSWTPEVMLRDSFPQILRYQQVMYRLEIVAIINWAQRYLELGMIHPLPTLPMYLFSLFIASRQTANSPLKKDDGMYTDTDDIRETVPIGDGSLWLWSSNFGLMNSQYWMEKLMAVRSGPPAHWHNLS